MSKKICRICLRTDIKTRDISDTLFDFHDEITEYGIYENPALKYCSICEHQLHKFYKFSERCRQANTILKTVKREKNGRLPTNLHKHLPPSSLGVNDRSSLKLFSLKNGQLEPILDTIKVKSNGINSSQLEPNVQTMKVEIDLESDSEATDTLQTVDEVEYNFVQSDEFGNTYVARVFNVSEIINNQDTNNFAEPENVFMEEHTGTKYSLSNSEDQPTQENDELGTKQVKLEDNSSDANDSNEDSDTDMINEFKKRILSTKESKLKYKGEKRGRKKQNERQSLKNLKDLENIFDIQVFASEEEAKQEMESRKTSEPYLSSGYKCEICYTVYKYSKLLDYHKRCHSPSSGEHVCSICYMRFPTKRATDKHKYSAHFGKFKCKRCPLITYQRAVLQTHYQHHAGVIYSCQQCDRTFTHASTYKTHIRLRHKTEHVCVTCARTFVSERGLMAHRNMIHHTKSKVDNDAKERCEPCDLTFADESVYTLHIMNTERHKDLAQAIIACKTCGARFEDTNDLRQHRKLLHPPHLNSDTDRKPTDKCQLCGVTGTGFAWLYHHFRSNHADASYDAELAHRRVHMCDTCGKCYTTMYALRDHINTHTGTKPYACAVCPARFTSRSKQLNHSEFHEPAKRECAQCGKMFVSASNLSNHMRFHTQDRRYKCSLCHKGFLHAATLREHVRGVHLNVRRVRKILKRETQTKAVDQ